MIWIASVSPDNPFVLAGIRPAPDNVLSRSPLPARPVSARAGEFLISGPDEAAARASAEKVLARAQRAEARAKGPSQDVHPLDALAAFLDELRAHTGPAPAVDLTPESVRENGIWFGREDMLDTIERWCIARRSER